MITVWGRATSSNVQSVTWTLGELGLEFDRRDVGGAFGGLDTPEYRAMNPNSKIPVLQDGDLTMYESNAIVRYLSSKYGNNDFWPENLADRARADMWLEWSKTTLAPVVNGGIFWTLVRTPMADRDPVKLAADIEMAGTLLEIVADQLGDNDYLLGNTLSAADIGIGHLLYRYMTLELDRPDVPAINRYYRRLSERPAYAEHAMVSYESMRIE